MGGVGAATNRPIGRGPLAFLHHIDPQGEQCRGLQEDGLHVIAPLCPVFCYSALCIYLCKALLISVILKNVFPNTENKCLVSKMLC